MQWVAALLLATAVTIGGGVTKQSGIEQFWTDDYKVFDQVYGKTSDKEIFGGNLPTSIKHEPEIKSTQASDKKERIISLQKDTDINESYSNDNKFNIIKTGKKKRNRTKSNFNFVSNNDFRPISQSSDPETYNYLKRLEEVERDRKKLPIGANGFQPNTANYFGPNPEETDAYKSIQDILDAHEANKGNGEAGSSKYLTYREKETNLKKKPGRSYGSKGPKPRCPHGRCRTRSSGPKYRSKSRSRPYVRKIIKKVVKY